MGAYAVEIAALATAAVLLVRGRELSVAVALLAPAVLPFYAFVEGHPFRIRYMIPLVAASAMLSGLGVGLLRAGNRLGEGSGAARSGPLLAIALAAVLIGSVFVESPPWSGQRAPMIAEAELDYPASIERRAVTACLAPEYRGEKVLASMGSLAHYMQELSADGFAIADFINEGNGTIWNVAVSTGPADHAGWMLVEEEAEGGDILAERVRTDPSFARGMRRVCSGGGVALYRRDESIPASEE